MAVVMNMHWLQVSPAQYDQVRRETNWEGDVPHGAKFHVAWFVGEDLHVLDVWESPADFERFVGGRLMPVVQRVGLKGQPNVTFAAAHAIFAPNV
jgi:hypothetical protein